MATQRISRIELFSAAFVSMMMVFIMLAFLRPADAQKGRALAGGIGQLVDGTGGYTGSLACASCHESAFHAWAQSQHAFAMAEATDATVRGDFNDIRVAQAGATGRFYREHDRFLVETENQDGQRETFTVWSVFGVEPLQQYLVRFPDGRVQVLPWAWDTRPREQGGQNWFAVYGDEPIAPHDSLHWTRGQQNWNFMCAECHSTALRKNYDVKTDRFATSYSEISVGCEACHGPGASHIHWAKNDRSAQASLKGFAFKAASRPAADWSINPATGSPSHGVARAQGDNVETCARCHARRATISENWKPGEPLEATHIPTFLSDGLFEADGIMRDEVFNDHSFKQSLMYAKGVVCSDCHDPHSAKLKAPGAQICSQCHDSEKFASITHTRHQGPQAPDCVSCHMPARTYIVVDRRHDHSFRIPRPDLSMQTGAPNACNDCHRDQSAAWASEALSDWFGPQRRGFQTWGEAFALARRGDPAALSALLAIINNVSMPAVVRATALDEAQRFPSRAVAEAAKKSLGDPAPIIRLAAVRGLSALSGPDRLNALFPLLRDPILSVRIAAAQVIASSQLAATLPLGEALAYETALGEAEAALALNADRPEGRAGLAQLWVQMGRVADAELELRAALSRFPDAAALAINLADFYRATGQEANAHAILTSFTQRQPHNAAALHALGLSLVRQKSMPAALDALKRAYEADPTHARYAFVYGVALQSAGQSVAGRSVLEKALQQHPWNFDLNNALLADALRGTDTTRAAPYAARLAALRPDDPSLAQLATKLKGQ